MMTLVRRSMLVCGAMGLWDVAARAQRRDVRVLGYLSFAAPDGAAPFLAAFRQGLAEAGYLDTKNVVIEYRWAEYQADRLPKLAADLVRRKVDIIVTGGGPRAALAAKQATSEIPVLFTAVGDPVADGLVTSLARPGGNVTGLSILVVELNAKRLELLSELVPQAKVVALIVNPSGSAPQRIMNDVQDAAHARGLRLFVLQASAPAEIDAAFASLGDLHADALVVASDPLFNYLRAQFVALASRYAVPAIYEFREAVTIGGLASYGPSQLDFNHQTGLYAGRILNGEKPENLPVQQPTKIEMAINLKTATALGVTVPASVLARADEVLE